MAEMTLYQKCKPIAVNNVEHYMTDFTKHDRQLFRRFDNGDVLIWLVRPCGTNLFRIHAGDDADIGKPWDWIRAFREGHGGKVNETYRIDMTARNRGKLTKLPAIPRQSDIHI